MKVVLLNGCIHIRDDSIGRFIKVNRTNLRKALGFHPDWLPAYSKKQLVVLARYIFVDTGLEGSVKEKDVNRVHARFRINKRGSV